MFYAKKIISMLLIAVFMFSVVSCGTNTDNSSVSENTIPENNNAGSEGDDGDNSDTPKSKWDREPIDLPDMDFNGRDFNVVTIDVTEPNRMYDLFAVEEQTGEPINDALYTRRINIEERYNINLKYNQVGSPADLARRSILAGDNAHDLIVDTIGNVRNLAGQQILADLYTVPYISNNITKPWWDQAVIRDLSINGKLYFQAGDIVLRDKLRVSCLYFNKDMAKDLGLEYPYQLVYDGKWTIDTLMEITKGVNIDLNGDGVMDQHDQWGFMSQHEFALQLFSASGEKMVSLDNNGVPIVTMTTPRALDVIQKALAVCLEPGAMFHADKIQGSSNVWLTASEYFQENRFLMRASVFEPIPRDLRAMPTDFGILPTPKFNEQQENYHAYAEMSGLVIGIPINADLEFVGLITEAMAYESGTTLMPAFYDLCLTSKVLRDDESEGMLDIIFTSKVYDIGYIYAIGSMPGILNELVSSGNADFISRFERVEGAINTALQRFIETYE